MDNYHLTNKDGSWHLKREGAARASKVFEGKKQEATKASAEFMAKRGGSLKIHNLDGKIGEERTYPRSADPKKTPG